jgi:hypothetical protein
VTTYHNDNLRTGLNSAETKLTPLNVNSATFGMLFALPVDGDVYAEPLYMSALTIPGKGVHNVVFVATEHNSVYAFDADTPSTPLWQVNLGPSVPCGDTHSKSISPEVGITSTPAILPALSSTATATLYVVAKTKTLDANGDPIYANSLHALDVTNGAEKCGGPVTIQATVAGTGEGSDGFGHVSFQPLIQFCRAGLLVVKGANSIAFGEDHRVTALGGSNTVYMGFGSHGDGGPYHGWLFGYDATTLKQTMVLNTSPNAVTDPSGWPVAGGGIWQSGAGLAADSQSLYFTTGNGTFNPSGGAFGDSIVRCRLANLQVMDYFTPSDQLSLDYGNTDQGSGGAMLLPPGTGSKAHPNLMVQCGKEGSIFLLDTNNLGKYNPGSNQVVQELPLAIAGVWGAPAYFNGQIYFGSISRPIVSLPIANGVLGKPTNYGLLSYRGPNPTPAISSNGTSNGIVWAIQSSPWGTSEPANLQAYNAANMSLLYNSGTTNGRDLLGPGIKFSVPTVANGKVYVGTGTEVDVFGLGQWAAIPTVSVTSGSYAGSVTVSLTDSTPGSTIYYTTDGSVPTTGSTAYKGPVTFASSVTLTARAFAPGYGASAQVQASYVVTR